jgi:GNAT superfamily N-acetyltransferase
MTDMLTPARPVAGVTIRAYRPSDHHDCRLLWAELTTHRQGLYGESPREADPGAGFEEYLTQLNLSGMWVADTGTNVGGFVGLMLDGRSGAIDPVVVAETMRGRGIGRALLSTVVGEARRRGLRRLSVSPSARDLAALHSLHAAGFGTVATVTLAYDLTGRRSGGAAPGTSDDAGSTLDLYDLRFDI